MPASAALFVVALISERYNIIGMNTQAGGIVGQGEACEYRCGKFLIGHPGTNG